MDSAMPTGPFTGGNFRPGWHAYCFYPPTVYVTARRPRKPLPVKCRSLFLRAWKVPVSVSLFLTSLLLYLLNSYFSPAVNSSPLPPNAESDRLRVILVAPRNPLNIGAAARAMSNFGFFHLRVVNPYELAFREARSAVGAEPVLAQAEEFKTVAEAVEDCTLVVGTTAVGLRQLQHPVRRLDQAARLLRKHLAGNRVALLFGSEKRGLSNEDLSHCHWLLRIPTREEHRSMNLGQAVAVCLYELARDPQAISKPEKHVPATAADLERLTALLLDALRSSGYVKAAPSALQKRRSAAPTEEKIRRLVRRLRLSAADADLTLGILRQIFWKLASTKAPSAED
jgi:TrmH family RNA methyltransferase